MARDGRWMRACSAALGAAASAAVTGCSGSDGFRPHLGQSAVELARHVPGCTDVKRTDGVGPAVGTSATCTLDAHGVSIVSFASKAAATRALITQSSSSVNARGATWFADVGAGVLMAQGTPRDRAAQRRVLAKVTKALGGTVDMHH